MHLILGWLRYFTPFQRQRSKKATWLFVGTPLHCFLLFWTVFQFSLTLNFSSVPNYYLCEVHLWSEHLAVTVGQPFCGSDKNFVPGPRTSPPPPPLKVSRGHMGNIQFPYMGGGLDVPGPLTPPPTEGLQGLCGQYTYGRWQGCHTWYLLSTYLALSTYCTKVKLPFWLPNGSKLT